MNAMKKRKERKWAWLILPVLAFTGTGHSLGQERAMGDRMSQVHLFFNQFDKDRVHLADDFYDPDVVFLDPVVEIRGRDRLKAYYAGLYEGVTSIHFDFSGGIENDKEIVVFWTMEFSTEGLRGGKPVSLEGASHIRFGGPEGKAVYHRDYFDMGALVYENVPVLGSIVRYTKKRLGKHASE